MTNSDPFQERVVKVLPSDVHYSLLVAPDGRFLGIDQSRRFNLDNEADDSRIWSVDEAHVQHVTRGVILKATSNGDFTADIDGKSVPCRVEHGPERMPSEYLAEMKSQGWTCLTRILSDATLEALERIACTDRYQDREYDNSMPPLCQDPAVARTAVEPVSMWVVRQYMQTADVRIAHVPGFAVLTPDDGKRVVQGWHSDYPYHWGINAQGKVPTSSGETVMGVQRNVCISDFTARGGATAFKLGSHARQEPPPKEWGIAADHYQPGYRAEHGLPYHGPDADIIEAPGGSIILYDSRTWHRAGINRTTRKRAALLQAMVPMYIMPKNDTSRAYKSFLNSPAYSGLNRREQTEFRKLMVHYHIGPGGQYAITTDRELTDHIRVDEAATQGY